MANITELANELTLEILLYFEYDKATLCQLALVSSHFRPLAQQVLLKHLTLSVDVLEDEGNSSLDYILKIPNIATLVQTLSLSWRDAHLKNNSRANHLLKRLPLLESLDISTTLYMPPEYNTILRPSFGSLETHPLNRLTKLKLECDITWLGLIEFMYLPKLEHIYLHHLPPVDTTTLPEKFRGRTSPVRTIVLQQCKSGRPVDHSLKRLLQRAEKLEVLNLTIGQSPGGAVSYRPFIFGQSLAPARHTLRILTITGPGMDRGMDGSRLDLSSFQKLQRVEVFSLLFFSSTYAHRARDGLYRLLPQSLLELKVTPSFQFYGYVY
jgi:hypothetical protein